MSINGIKKVQQALQAHKRKALRGLRKGFFRAGLFLQRASMKLVPIDTGTLRESAATTVIEAGFDVIVEVSYSAAYAIFVHEDLEARHKPPRQAKFLEQPFRDHKDNLTNIVKSAIQEEQ